MLKQNILEKEQLFVTIYPHTRRQNTSLRKHLQTTISMWHKVYYNSVENIVGKEENAGIFSFSHNVFPSLLSEGR